MAEKKFKITIKKYRGESSVVSLRLPNNLIASIDEITKRTGRTRNDIMQKCIEYSIENLEISEEK